MRSLTTTTTTSSGSQEGALSLFNTSSSISNTSMSANLASNYQSNFSNLNNSGSLAGGQRLDWESLRKQARQLENEIDSKLVAFSKLSSSFSASTFNNRNASLSTSASSNQSSNSSSSSSDLLFITLSNEIEESLKKLTVINNRMSDSLNADTNNMNSSGTVHTLQRHRDILRDYSTEYEKTKRNIISFKEREKLLSSSNASRSSTINETNLNNRRLDNGSSNNPQTSLYMKEYDHLKSSHSLVDQQLEIAELTKENLQSQRQHLRMIQQKMNTLAHKFPLINNLVQRIKLKKRKDTIVMAIVISICLIIMLLYLF